MADSLIQITVGLLEEPATVAERLLRDSSDAHSLDAAVRLLRELGGTLVAKDAKATVRVDSVTRGAAAATITCVQASATAGDELHFTIPGYPRVTLTAVTGAATASDGEYSIDTSNTAMGASLDAAIEANALLKRHLTVTNSTGTVTVTAREPGTWAHDIIIGKSVTTAAAHVITAMSGGDDVLAKPSITVTFGSADITANDTISVGARKYTWVSSADADGEITLSATPATAATNFAAAINDDDTWTGLLTAEADDEDVTLTWEGDPRAGAHIIVDYAESNSGSVTLGGTAVTGSGEAFAIGTTIASESTARTFGRGAA